MHKLLTFVFGIFYFVAAQAQMPDNYYDAAEGLYGNELKNALYTIIKGHTEYPYTASGTDVWDILKETDKDTIDDTKVILFYTGWTVDAAQEYNSGSGWSREHVWAKSRGDFGTSLGAGTDAHHLRPADISVNSARNNRWFDNCSDPYVDGDGETGCYTSSTRWVWQPRDVVKGDVARMIFYMATRYEGENGEPDLEVIDYLPSDNNTDEPVHAKLSTLLEWHAEDPVDDFERNRNEVIYSYQNNRNPFIDHPEFVDRIWGNSTSLERISTSEIKLHIYPNPADENIVISLARNVNGNKYLIHIVNRLGSVVYASAMNGLTYEVQLSDSIGKGLFFVQILTQGGELLDVKKIVLK